MKEFYNSEIFHGFSYLQTLVFILGVVLSLTVVVFLGGIGSKPFDRFSTKRRSRKSRKTKKSRLQEEHTTENLPQEWQKPERVSGLPNYSHPSDPPPNQNHVSRSLKRGTWPNLQEPVQSGNFKWHFREMASTEPSGFKKEFQRLVGADETRCTIASREINKPKNRFRNIKPYDDTRVTLSTGSSSSDYINASYIQGVRPNGVTVQNMYIATQGPLDRTIPDFWQMIWEQSCPFIVMLTNPIENKKVKCATYWPEKDNYKNLITMRLRNLQEEVWPFYVRRTIGMIKDGFTRKVIQYQFTSWDDKETLETAMPIWEVLDQMWANIDANGCKGPVVVHCSAGVGRTGTFIALDTLRSILLTEKEVDVFNVISDMRNRRMLMIQVEEQYKFLYESLLIFQLLKQTSFKVTKFKRDMRNWWRDVKTRQRERAEKEFELLNDVCPPKKYSRQQDGERMENRHKNRFKELIPYDENRPLLMTIPTMDPNPNNYINASFHHSFQKKNAFIATQSPLPETMGAFWSLVFDYSVATIVMFDEDERECPVYWPSIYQECQYGDFYISCPGEDQLTNHVKSRKFTLTSRMETRYIKQLCVDGRQDQNAMADCMTAVVKFVRDWQRETGNNPILVHCRSGLGLAGCFMAIYSAIDRLNTQHVVDVFTTVRRLRHTRPNVVDTKDRYEMIYEALNIYLIQTEKSYSNFHDF